MIAPTGVFRSLKSFNYRVWAAGAFVSNVGTWVQRTAQTWLVLTDLTHHNASAVGVVMALQFGPQLLLLPWTGAAADRLNQRRLLFATQATMGALSLALGLVTVAGLVTLSQVYAFAFLFGCAAAFDAPVRQTFVGELVGDADLANAVGLNSTSFNAARMIGPAVAGLVIAAFGAGWAFLINGASFLAVLASLLALRRSELRPNARASRARGGFVEGLRYASSRPDLMAILAMLFLIGTFGFNFSIFVATMAVGVFHVDALGYGLLSSIMAIGTVAGALVAAGGERPRFRSLVIGSGLFGLGCGPRRAGAELLVFRRRAGLDRRRLLDLHQYQQQPDPAFDRAGDARADDGAEARRPARRRADRRADHRLDGGRLRPARGSWRRRGLWLRRGDRGCLDGDPVWSGLSERQHK